MLKQVFLLHIPSSPGTPWPNRFLGGEAGSLRLLFDHHVKLPFQSSHRWNQKPNRCILGRWKRWRRRVKGWNAMTWMLGSCLGCGLWIDWLMDADGSFLRFWEATGQSMKHTDCKMEVSPIWPRNGTTLAGLAAFWVGSYSDLTRTHLVAKNWKNTEKTYQHVHWRSLAKTSWYNPQPTWSWFKWHIPRHFSGLVFEARRCGTGLGRGSHLHPRGFEGGNWCDVTPDDNSAGGGSDHFSQSNLKKNGCNLPCDFAPWTGCATTTSSRFWACVFSRFWSFHILLMIDVPDIFILAIDSKFLWQLSHFWS